MGRADTRQRRTYRPRAWVKIPWTEGRIATGALRPRNDMVFYMKVRYSSGWRGEGTPPNASQEVRKGDPCGRPYALFLSSFCHLRSLAGYSGATPPRGPHAARLRIWIVGATIRCSLFLWTPSYVILITLPLSPNVAFYPCPGISPQRCQAHIFAQSYPTRMVIQFLICPSSGRQREGP